MALPDDGHELPGGAGWRRVALEDDGGRWVALPDDGHELPGRWVALGGAGWRWVALEALGGAGGAGWRWA